MKAAQTLNQAKVDGIKEKLSVARDEVKMEREKWMGRLEKLNEDLQCVNNHNYMERRRHRDVAATQAMKSSGKY